MAAWIIDYLEHRPHAIPIIADWVWQQWGFDSPRTCAADLTLSRHGAIPSRFVALYDDRPVGIVSLIECNLPLRCHLSPWLAGLFVHPPYRRAGIGSALVRLCEDEARKLGVGRLYLYTERAEGFYRRLGWTTEESLEWEGSPVALMSQDLAGPN